MVSVVVPAHNAEATVPDLLAALDRTTFSEPWELVLVDDGSDDTTAELAAAWGARVVRLEGQGGPAAARNAGLAAAAAPLIAFTDADCQPAPGWLAAIVDALGAADLVTGPVLPVEGVPVGPFRRTLNVTRESHLFETANLGVTRVTAERVGGFVPFVPPADGRRAGLRPTVDQGHFGEDAVFGWSARRLGARTAFARDAVVRHAVFGRGPRGYIAERWRLRFFPALVREFPELRAQLRHRYFLSARTERFDLAVLGIGAALVTRRPAWALAAVPYLADRLTWRQPWRRSIARRNLALVIADVVGCAALVRGSVAARRLLL